MDFIDLYEIEPKKPVVIALSGVGRGLRGRVSGNNLTNVQYKPNWNCHNESPLYNEYTNKKGGRSFYKVLIKQS
jgi:hypothetical protein